MLKGPQLTGPSLIGVAGSKAASVEGARYSPALKASGIVWDDAKARTNYAKHGVSFEEAAALLRSSCPCLELFDEAHSDDEDRFLTIGPVERGLILVVWTERSDDEIRIIGARWATPQERRQYFDNLSDGS